MLITSKTPKLDLHNEIVAMCQVLVDNFIKENYLLKEKYVLIIHGKNTNILKKETHRVLKKNPYVLNYRLDNWNLGQTIVELKEREN